MNSFLWLMNFLVDLSFNLSLSFLTLWFNHVVNPLSDLQKFILNAYPNALDETIPFAVITFFNISLSGENCHLEVCQSFNWPFFQTFMKWWSYLDPILNFFSSDVVITIDESSVAVEVFKSVTDHFVVGATNYSDQEV